MDPVRIKVCGLRTFQDVNAAFESGADTAGFVFYSKSPRAVTPDQIAPVLHRAPERIRIAGLFVNEEFSEIVSLSKELGLDMVQLHGDETPELADKLVKRGIFVIKAIRVAGPEDVQRARLFPMAQILFDARVPDTYGGSGQSFDWHVLDSVHGLEYPFILAGGLTAENVSRAVRITRAGAVDASSSLESAPGVKDHELIKKFVAAAKNTLKD